VLPACVRRDSRRLLVALALPAALIAAEPMRPIAIPLGLDLYLPVPEENPLTADKIELGKRPVQRHAPVARSDAGLFLVPRSGASFFRRQGPVGRRVRTGGAA
jgi:hypothetical protein